jgi:hypothetical protein
MKSAYDVKMGVKERCFKVGDVVKLKNHTKTKFTFKFVGPFYIVEKGRNVTYSLQRPDGRRYTDMSGRDLPINAEHLYRFNDFDAEYYYSGKAMQAN